MIEDWWLAICRCWPVIGKSRLAIRDWSLAFCGLWSVLCGGMVGGVAWAEAVVALGLLNYHKYSTALEPARFFYICHIFLHRYHKQFQLKEQI